MQAIVLDAIARALRPRRISRSPPWRRSEILLKSSMPAPSVVTRLFTVVEASCPTRSFRSFTFHGDVGTVLAPRGSSLGSFSAWRIGVGIPWLGWTWRCLRILSERAANPAPAPLSNRLSARLRMPTGLADHATPSPPPGVLLGRGGAAAAMSPG